MGRVRKKYSSEFKREILRQIEDGEKTAAELGRQHSIAQAMISRWRSQAEQSGDQAFPGQGNRRHPKDELTELTKAYAVLEEENAILKKAAAYMLKDLK